jgi:nitrate/TMAO reductase-like tetraheme cytochrome c subunit
VKFDWQKILEELGRNIVKFPQEAIGVLRTPQSDPRTTILVLSIFLVGVLLLAVLGLALWSTFLGRRAGEEELVEEPVEAPLPPPESSLAPSGPRRLDYAKIGIIAAAVLVALGTASYYTSTPSFCANCHVVKKEYKSWTKSSHQEVGCLSCHQEPGVSGYLVQKAGYVREALLFASGNYTEPTKSQVSNKTCNRCHGKIAQGTVVRYGIKVRHQDFLEKGYKCAACHNTVAHGDNVPVQKFPTMDKCVICHDGREASAECNLCHAQTVTETRELRRELVKVAAEIPWHCRGCHAPQVEKKCMDCHGLEMPHSPEFLRGKHARSAFTQRSVCLKCHVKEEAFCNKCHVYPSPHGSIAEWTSQHGPAAKKISIVQVFLEDSQFVDCYLCHTRPNMCDACHVGQREVRTGEIRKQQDARQLWKSGPSSPEPEE